MTATAATARRVAIVDHGLGNLFSVAQACRAVGLTAEITAERAALERADAVVLPGVGAFGDAMATLRRLDLVGPIRDLAAAGKPLVGICLGVQLLMTESCEFGHHEGLGLIKGRVVPLGSPRESGRTLRVPQVGWNRVNVSRGDNAPQWSGTLLDGLRDGEFMYFVHSFIVVPDDPAVVLSTTRYGDVEFCSSVTSGSVFACQFHPERSGNRGLDVYRNLHRMLGSQDGQ